MRGKIRKFNGKIVQIHWKCQILQDGQRKIQAIFYRGKDWPILAKMEDL